MEQPLDDTAAILDIWNAWGNAQSEVGIVSNLQVLRNVPLCCPFIDTSLFAMLLHSTSITSIEN